MPNDDGTFRNEYASASNEAVCLDVMRVYDSCGSKDCLEDLCVYLCPGNQAKVNKATSVRLKKAEIINVYTDVDPLPFHKGYYSVNITFYFNVCLELNENPAFPCEEIEGLAIFSKQVVMYGSEGKVKIYTSECDMKKSDCSTDTCMPIANVQVAQPVALGAKIICGCKNCSCCNYIPEFIAGRYGGELSMKGEKNILVSIGIFTIVQIVRRVQMLVPAYDYCVPCKECKISNDNPCDMFSKIDFPSDEFFPVGERHQHCESDDNGLC